jgi:hypothetical protein
MVLEDGRSKSLSIWLVSGESFWFHQNMAEGHTAWDRASMLAWVSPLPPLTKLATDAIIGSHPMTASNHNYLPEASLQIPLIYEFGN